MQKKGDKIRDIIVAILSLGDAIGVGFAMVGAYFLRIESGFFAFVLVYDPNMVLSDYLGHFIFGIALFIGLSASVRLYRRNELLLFRRSGPRLLRICFYWMMIYLMISLVFKFQPEISRLYVVLSAIFIAAILFFWRWCLFQFLRKESVSTHLRQSILLIGWSPEMESLLQAILKDPQHPYVVLGMIETGRDSVPDLNHNEIISVGTVDELEEILGQYEADILLLADYHSGLSRVAEYMNLAGKHHMEFKMLSSFFPLFSSGLRVQTLSRLPVLGIEELSIMQWHNRWIKRLLDIAGAGLGLIIALPIMGLFAFLVWKESPGPVFYSQTRIGRRGKQFKMYKIRSMRLDAEKLGIGWSVPNDPRRLKIGGFMRKWNIDELPQFWNVLLGDMTLVGPRPERPEYVAGFKDDFNYYNVRHSVKPGISGWAQIQGWRGDTDIGERLRCDLYYVEHWSIWMDLYIILTTLFRTRNAY
ncbi:MAG: sugar transferase [Verrucomicrobiota bacterium]